MPRTGNHHTYTAVEVRAAYGVAQAEEELASDWFGHCIYRPLSFAPAAWLLNRGVTANQVTLAGLLLALSLPLQAAWLDQAYVALACSGLLFGLLDCVDGNMARSSGSGSPLGQYADFATDIAYRLAMYVALGLLVGDAVGAPAAALVWLLGAALLMLFARLCRYYDEYRLGQAAAPPAGDAPRRGLGDRLFVLLSGLDSALPLLLLAAGLADRLPWLAAWLVAYSLGDFVTTQAAIIRRLVNGR
jgi:phosphatidylglycerophosphate synthase